jgi:hypothetical protein
MKTNIMKNRAADGHFIRTTADAMTPVEPGDLSRFEREGGQAALPGAGVSEHFRRLKWNEVVRHGDYVGDERLGLEPWEGPGGFQADTFLKPIYRKKLTGRFRPVAARKPK